MFAAHKVLRTTVHNKL